MTEHDFDYGDSWHRIDDIYDQGQWEMENRKICRNCAFRSGDSCARKNKVTVKERLINCNLFREK